jgi:hypothetical protein
MSKNAKKAVIKLFFRQLFINIIIGIIGLVLGLFLYHLTINKTNTEYFTDNIIIYDTYINDKQDQKEYVSEFRYNNYILKSIGYSTYLYCQTRRGKNIKADLIKTVWINRKDKRTDYQILKLYMNY